MKSKTQQNNQRLTKDSHDSANDSRDEASLSCGAVGAKEALRIDANAYFVKGCREIDVFYKNKRYRLRLTAQDKLLLTT
jgi:hemin uptake protein HemP